MSVFLPAEQAALAQTASGQRRTQLSAWYNLAGNFAGAFGSLASGLPALIAHASGLDVALAERFGFVLYAARPLAVRRFDLSVEMAGAIFFAAGTLGGLAQLVSPLLAARIGLVRTMVYTHLPANLLLVAAGLVPSAHLAVTFLLLRALLLQMDVSARQAYVMAVVPPEERAAAASVTNVPRSLAAALPPLFMGAMLTRSAIGWPLVCGGLLKALYDVVLLEQFRAVPTMEE